MRPDLAQRLCPGRAAYTGDGLILAEAVEGIGELIGLPDCELPASGYVTTIDDLHRFAEMLRRGGELDGVRILSPATMKFATQIHTGSLRNVKFDPFASYRNWETYPPTWAPGSSSAAKETLSAR